jgi:hypothetical protein
VATFWQAAEQMLENWGTVKELPSPILHGHDHQYCMADRALEILNKKHNVVGRPRSKC